MNNKLETKYWSAFRASFMQTESNCLTLFRMGFFGAAHRWGGNQISYTYPTMMKLGTVIHYPKKIQSR